MGLLVALAMAAQGCLGTHDCDYGQQRCAGAPGHYEECSGGEGYAYWSERTCNGLAPVCVSTENARVTCSERAQPAACPAGVDSPRVASGVFAGAADADGDGVLDLVFVQERSLSIAHGDGAGHFARGVTSSATFASGPRSARVAEVDGSGALDLVVSTWDPPEAYVFSGNGGGRFSLAHRYFLSDATTLTDAGDLDGDGRDEVIGVSNGTGGPSLVVLSGLGSDTIDVRSFSSERLKASLLLEGARIFKPAGAAPEILVSGNDSVLLAPNGAGFDAIASFQGTPLATDLDGDGADDLLVLGPYDSTLTAYMHGGLAAGTQTSVPQGGTLRAALDANGDHFGDAVIDYAGKITVLPGTGTGAFGAALAFTLPGFESTALTSSTDLDGDGRQDGLVVLGSDVSVLRGACTVD